MKQVFKWISVLGALASVGSFVLNFNKDWMLKVSIEPKIINQNNFNDSTSLLPKENDRLNCPIFLKSTQGCD